MATCPHLPYITAHTHALARPTTCVRLSGTESAHLALPHHATTDCLRTDIIYHLATRGGMPPAHWTTLPGGEHSQTYTFMNTWPGLRLTHCTHTYACSSTPAMEHPPHSM